MKRNTTKFVECEDCECGEVYTDTSRQCMKAWGDCCGGCGYSTTCEECNGTGEIEVDIESYSANNKTRNRNFHSRIWIQNRTRSLRTLTQLLKKYKR